MTPYDHITPIGPVGREVPRIEPIPRRPRDEDAAAPDEHPRREREPDPPPPVAEEQAEPDDEGHIDVRA